MLRYEYMCLCHVLCSMWGSRKKLPDTQGKNSEVAVGTSGCVKICSKTWIILVTLELADSHCDPERQEAYAAFTFRGQLWIQPKPRSYFHQRALHWLCSVSSGSHQYTSVVWIRTENGWERNVSPCLWCCVLWACSVEVCWSKWHCGLLLWIHTKPTAEPFVSRLLHTHL